MTARKRLLNHGGHASPSGSEVIPSLWAPPVRAAAEAGVEPTFAVYLGDDPVAYVISLNLRRRHLDESQRQQLRATLKRLLRNARPGERIMKLLTPHLTPGHAPELAAQIRQSRPGMAHFAGTGPLGATCGECVHLGGWKQVRNAAGEIVDTTRVKGCAKFLALTGKHGPALPPGTPACKYFERHDGPPDVCTARAR